PADPLSPLRNLLVHPTASMKITMHPTTRLTSVEYHAGLERTSANPSPPPSIGGARRAPARPPLEGLGRGTGRSAAGSGRVGACRAGTRRVPVTPAGPGYVR